MRFGSQKLSGLSAVVIGAMCLGAGAVSAQSDKACDTELLGKIEGKYVGQMLGFRSDMTVGAHDAAACSLEASWQTFNKDAPVSQGTAVLTLEDGVLRGDWRAQEQSGRARFDVLRKGALLNGRMIGLKDEPSGPWDYSKLP